MNSLLGFALGIFIMGIFLLIYFLMSSKNPHKDTKLMKSFNRLTKNPHAPIILNFRSDETNGYAIGRIVDSVGVGMQSTIAKFFPLDCINEDFMNMQEPLIEPDSIIQLPEGTLSQRCTIFINLPSPEKMPDKLKATPFGKFLMMQSEMKRLVQAQAIDKQNMVENASKVIQEMSSADFTESIVNDIKPILQKMISETVRDVGSNLQPKPQNNSEVR